MKKLISAILLTALVLSMVVPATQADAAVCTAGPAKLTQKTVALTGSVFTDWYSDFYAETPELVTFVDSKGVYNLAYPNEQTLYIHRYDSNLQLTSTLQLPFRLPMFGNVICDTDGSYYVCWGGEDKDATNAEVLRVSKYDYQGNLLAERSINGFDAAPASPGSYWGTKIAFLGGTCSMAINNGILACNYAREMYSGHQSNHVIYLSCDSLERLDGSYPYCSHSFDQDCIATSDGGFLMTNHGDAHSRGFVVSKISGNRYAQGSTLTFHFREGSNRDHGYNETYAQLGGIVETQNSYVLCASSEKTLSLDTAPTKDSYCSYSEARNLFVQILKKDFGSYSGANRFCVAGETRKATGKRPANAMTELWLEKGTTDYGVIWLTDYSDDYFVANPKIVATGKGQFVLLWEKRSNADYGWYCSEMPVATYYMIMLDDGTVVRSATDLGQVKLPTDSDPVYSDGKIYWATSAKGDNATVNELEVDVHSYQQTGTTMPTLTTHGCTTFTCTVCGDSYVKNYTFPDVPSTLWSYNAIEFAVAKSFFTGYKSGNFGPADQITRQDFVVVLARIAKADLSKYSGRTSFPDVKAGDYYEKAVKWASSNGIVNGYQNGNFGVGDKITREQMVTILYNYARKMGYDTSIPADAAAKLNAYADANKITPYAKPAVIWALYKGVISGMTSTTIGPQQNASRGQTATILMNISKKNIMPI